jgi:hypothetical protein
MIWHNASFLVEPSDVRHDRIFVRKIGVILYAKSKIGGKTLVSVSPHGEGVGGEGLPKWAIFVMKLPLPASAL